MLKEDLLQYLKEHTNMVDIDNIPNCLTADELAKLFSVKRNTVSQYLNDMVEQDICFKITSRPVRFLHKAVFEQCYYPVTKRVYRSAEELKSDNNTSNKDKGDMKPAINLQEEDIFSKVIGYDGSLKKAVSMIKSSIFYPDNSLPIFITGETGTGKSFLAELTYKYAVEKGILKEGAPFVSFNCALYANNPELLTSNLFGHVKGAFTGADTAAKGVIEAADGGVLFLDEVHRLNSESQEKLFTFLDKGIFRRLGESESWHQSNVRIIAATTEDLEENFLFTFLRRFPIHIIIPSLKDRGESEKLHLIYNFLIREAVRFNKSILVTGKVLRALGSYTFEGNIGALKSTIKYICAGVNMRNQDKAKLEISLMDLPGYILKANTTFGGMRFPNYETILIRPDTSIQGIIKTVKGNEKKCEVPFFNLWRKYQSYRTNHKSKTEFEQDCYEEINIFFDKLIYEQKSHSGDVILQFITRSAEEIARYLDHNCKLHISGNNIFAIVVYMYYRDGIIGVDEKLIDPLLEYVEGKCKYQHKIAKDILKLIEDSMDIKPIKGDDVIIALYLKICGNKSHKANAIILAHGYATASSMADTVNRLLGKKAFDAFDMPLDLKVEDIIKAILRYIENVDIHRGLIILVDMGSLREIYNHLNNYFKEPVLIINNVSTQLALETGELILKDSHFEDIVHSLKRDITVEYNLIYPKEQRRKTILTCCATGLGTAVKLRKMIKSSIPADIDIKVTPYTYKGLKENGKKDLIFKEADIIGIIGTLNPKIEGIPYIDLEELVSGKSKDKINKMLSGIANADQIEMFNDNLVRYFTIERLIGTLTILDTNKIIGEIRICLEKYQYLTGQKLESGRKHIVYFHVACMTERLIRKTSTEGIEVSENNYKCRKDELKLIKSSFSGIENNYNVEIPVQELYHINKILTEAI